ncbi:hypothetical protein K505DRAFT_355059 [Melanomma pulvis-pyrius CBS 109.77]|uniref:Uncharacterized protein n=1 Tax=Melanomma pulvis-pyrius CBS 109.77 TaxID=1314802 RepID=A0A6A6XXN5_9PLEO|nr:hypothetical protein K505DRAFT_355059 [Melanomma pulvis-pyrius CBS 109.77]
MFKEITSIMGTQMREMREAIATASLHANSVRSSPHTIPVNAHTGTQVPGKPSHYMIGGNAWWNRRNTNTYPRFDRRNEAKHLSGSQTNLTPLTAEENESDIGYSQKRADLECWVRYAGKMYDIRQHTTPPAIKKMKTLSIAEVVLHQLQARGPVDVGVQFGETEASGNQPLQNITIRANNMFTSMDQLPNAKARTTNSTMKTAKTSTPAQEEANRNALEMRKSGGKKRKQADLPEEPLKRAKGFQLNPVTANATDMQSI